MSEWRTVRISENVYQLYESCGVFCSLVTGEKYALLIDTGYGFGDIVSKVRAVTDLPLKVINTHGHVDHIQGNKYFDEVMIHEADKKLIRLHSSLPVKLTAFSGLKKNLTSEEREHISQFFKPNRQKLVYIHDGCKIDIGGNELEVIHTPGHTQGSVCILDKKDRILFSGDTISSHVWLFLKESADVKTYAAGISKVIARKSEFDGIVSGHSAAVFKTTLLEKVLHCAQNIDVSKSVPFPSPLNKHALIYCEDFEKLHDKYGWNTFVEFLQHASEVPLSDLVDFEVTSIVYTEEKLR